MGDSIKCLAIINLYDNRTIFLSSLRSAYLQYFNEELDNMLKAFHSLHSGKKEISKIHSNTGLWYCKLNINKQLIYITLVNLKYPSQSAIRLLSDLEEEAMKIQDYDKRDLRSLLNSQAIFLMKNYDNNPDFNDKFKNLEQSIESITDLMGENIKKITVNKDELESIEKKAIEMEKMSEIYKGSSSQLKSQMFWQKYSTWLILGLIFVILLTIVIVIAVESNEDE